MDHAFNAPKNDYEALVLALFLGLIAETEKSSKECLEIGQMLAARLTPDQVEQAKEEALDRSIAVLEVA